MKTMFLLLAVLALSCGCSMQKSEEGIVLKMDTSSVLRGRTLDAKVTITNSDKAEQIKWKNLCRWFRGTVGGLVPPPPFLRWPMPNRVPDECRITRYYGPYGHRRRIDLSISLCILELAPATCKGNRGTIFNHQPERCTMARRREGKGSEGNKDTTMPKVSPTYPSRYKGPDNKTRGSVEPVKPTYPSRYK